ncbi:MAG TPA: hypothetical protein VFM38_06070 [Candidatus Limnocylindrales bacterium]|nr:hypothetical protein [Candidatus Limnocylindrales bacterium]
MGIGRRRRPARQRVTAAIDASVRCTFGTIVQGRPRIVQVDPVWALDHAWLWTKCISTMRSWRERTVRGGVAHWYRSVPADRVAARFAILG